MQSLILYIHQTDTAYVNPKGVMIEDRPLNRNSIRLVINELGDQAAISLAHPHRCRHTFCYNYVVKGGDPFTLCKIAGFILEIALWYVNMADSDAKRAHVNASLFDNWIL